MKTPSAQVKKIAVQLAAAFILILPAQSMAADSFAVPEGVAKVMKKYCYECHGASWVEADVRLDVIATVSQDERIGLLEKVQEVLYLRRMPPKDELQLSQQHRDMVAGWIQSELAKAGRAEAFNQRMQSPRYANYVEHDKLFSGEYKDLKGFTYDRKWMISEFIFKEKMNALLRVGEAKRTSVNGKSEVVRGHALPSEIANPFLLPSQSGVRYYANSKMGSGHLMTMIGNSKYVSESMVNYLSGRYPDFLPSVRAIAETKSKHEAILKSRDLYLSNHIDRLCEDLYGGENEDWLPRYSKIEFKDVSGKGLMFTGDRAQKQFDSFRNSAEGRLIEMAFFRYADGAKGREELIRACEKYWFHLGLQSNQIESMVEKLQVNLEDFLTRSTTDREKRSSAWKLNTPDLKPGELAVVSATIKELRTKGMSYKALQKACMDHWKAGFEKALEESSPLKGELPRNIIVELYDKIYEREPSQSELAENQDLLLSYSSKMGVDDAITKLTQTLLLSSEFINRNEYGVGQADTYGRRMMSPRDASYAIAYALTDSSPDEQLARAAREGRLNTRDDYKREVERLLKDRSHVYIIDNVIQDLGGGDNITDQPVRKIRFFREFFGYYNALQVFKDQTRFGHTIGGTRERLIAEADLLVSHILENDRDVFKELLTTDKFYVYHNGDNEDVAALSNQLTEAYRYFQENHWREFKTPADLEKHKDFILKHGVPGLKSKSKRGEITKIDKDVFQLFINIMADYEKRFENGKNEHITPYSNTRDTWIGPKRSLTYPKMTGVLDHENVTHYYNIDPDHWDYPPVQPFELSHRKGVLTHPAWLQAFSQNAHTDPVTRGKWIWEKLLVGTIPDIPIGVEAQIPQDHTKTLRDRLASVTKAEMCWRCHQYMNPLGNAFEMYDDFGRYRTEEELEHPDNVIGKEEVKKRNVKTHPLQTINNGGVGQGERFFYKTLPVDTTGVLNGTGDSKLDGEVKDAPDLMDRLAASTKVRQAFIRYAFRYFMGRNETLSDSKTLMDADEAYLKSGGSFDAVVVSLLTSDSFIYRKQAEE